MDHFLTIPINENGIITDSRIDAELQSAAAPPFGFTDVFIYSHGWWNTAADAAGEYNAFSLGVAASVAGAVPAGGGGAAALSPAALAMGIHWPSMLSEDQESVANFFEAASFYSMQMRADDVGEHGGYALLRLFLEGRQQAAAGAGADKPAVRFHLIGHSFGCRVVCAALQAMAQDDALVSLARESGASFDAILIQAATDADSLNSGGLYGGVLQQIPNLRVLITTSARDLALGQWYPAAQRLAHLFGAPVSALGAAGPQGDLADRIDARIAIGRNSVPDPAGDFVVADLTPLHDGYRQEWIDAGNAGNWGGQHSDIFHAEIYELLARFIAG